MKKYDQTSKIMGLKLFSNKKSSLLSLVTRELASDQTPATRPILVFTPNPEQVVLASRNPAFAQLLPQVDYLLPDGIGLVWASQLLSNLAQQPPIKERITGVEFCQDLLNWAQKNHRRCLIIGGKGYEQFAAPAPKTEDPEVWQLQHQPLLYWTPGYQDVSAPSVLEEEKLSAVVSSLQPELVFVAFGAPHQERWVIEHRELLTKSKVRLAMVVGGAFDVILGKKSRAPRWMLGGGEWLYRLFQEPWRWRRQLQLFVFMAMVVQEGFSLLLSSPGEDSLKNK